MPEIPSQVMDFRVYNEAKRVIGAGAEITLPTIKPKTYTADLPAGELDLPSMRTENFELEIPFTVFDKEAGEMVSLNNVTTVTIRSSVQKTNTETHNFKYSGLKVTAKGFAKEVALGTLKRSDKMDSKITMTLTYIKIEDGDGYVFAEIDKLNGTYIINGEDVIAGIDKYL